LFLGESLKSESAWDYSVNMKFNVFLILISTLFLHLWNERQPGKP